VLRGYLGAAWRTSRYGMSATFAQPVERVCRPTLPLTLYMLLKATGSWPPPIKAERALPT